ncbi:TonB-dependent receptor [Azovibrio restrictus]|uniref:TonB-dependent receptor n=1 Tax=Azovibrio restrictus TaxID=146938 RepID=UPI0026EA747B|nr:TonB-dependent receptor [Azovibrio restrictus]MDD3484018.1 TonB-dependent receptor [Azovibrio restrictus]
MSLKVVQGAVPHIPRSMAVAVLGLFCHLANAQSEEKFLAPVKTTADADLSVQEKSAIETFSPYSPMSGTTISSEVLDTVKFVDPRRELLWRVPGMTLIRNIRIPDGSKSYTDKRVDGMRVNTYSTGNFNALDETSPSDVERVEVITGPGSVLSSSNAFGGTINVITRDPPRELERRISQEVGDFGLYRTDYSQGGSVNKDLGYFFNLNYMDDKGWRENESASQKKGALSGKIVYRPDEYSKLTARLEYLNDISRAPGSISEEQFLRNWRGELATQYKKTDTTYVTPSLQYKRRIGEHGELNISALNRATRTKSLSATSANAMSISEGDTTENSIQSMYRHDFSFALSTLYLGVDTTWMDAESKNYKNTTSYAQALDGDFSRGALNTYTLGTEKHTSPFLHYEFSPADALRLSMGVRQDDFDLETNNKLGDKGDGRKSFSRLVKKLGATYEFSGGYLLWARAAEGFLAPSISDMLGTGGTPNQTTYVPMNMNLKPIESMTYELGLRGQLLSKRLRFDTAYFDTDLKNMIVREDCAPSEPCYQRNVNAGKARLHGLETSIAFDVTRWLDAGLSHTWSVVKYKDYKTPTYDYSGNTWKGAPEHHLNLRVGVKPMEHLRAELEYDHIASYYRNNENVGGTYKRPDLFHLRIAYKTKTWSTWLHVLNLFDKKYAERAWMTAAGKATYDEGYKPLTLRAGVSYNF